MKRLSLKERIQILTELGTRIKNLLHHEDEKYALLSRVFNDNPWFINEFTLYGLNAIRTQFLQADLLQNWASLYPLDDNKEPKHIALTIAGNLPLVGFHDFVCTFISGHKAMIKLSSKDKILFPVLLDMMTDIRSEAAGYFELVQGPHKKMDAVIATGSNNSARYFEYYFSKYPHVIRRNKNSVAVITGNETIDELRALGDDVFLYFGMGCRSVSKLLLPEGYDISKLFSAWEKWAYLMNHHKYANNYIYNKSILMVNNERFEDSEFIIMKESRDHIASPVGMLYFEYYQDIKQIPAWLEMVRDEVQATICTEEIVPGTVIPGQSQLPRLDQYPDHVDVMTFLNSLK